MAPPMVEKEVTEEESLSVADEVRCSLAPWLGGIFLLH